MSKENDEKIVDVTKPIEGKIAELNKPIDTSWGFGSSVSDVDPDSEATPI